MMNFFGKKKKNVNTTVSSTSTSKPSDAQTTIVKLRESIVNQDKREEHIQKKINGMVVEAKGKMAKGDKKGTSTEILVRNWRKWNLSALFRNNCDPNIPSNLFLLIYLFLLCHSLTFLRR
mmetsp:Transcript_23220/g.64381  ORF Transcript_23220/g.64381 Transcript_23220/m.64381 type:complete len:120 (+) Transcript_23220:410-769(+)